MSVELKIPALGESIQEVQIGRWLKREGDKVKEDEDMVELETDKASMELPAPATGVLAKILKQEGDSVSIGEAIAVLEEDGRAATKEQRPDEEGQQKHAPPEMHADAKVEEPRKQRPSKAATELPPDTRKSAPAPASEAEVIEERFGITPSARRALREFGVHAEDIEPSGPQLRREDVVRHVQQRERRPVPDEQREDRAAQAKPAAAPAAEKAVGSHAADELEDVVPMSLIRRRIAQRLVEAQQKAALLTTFNEVDMSAVIALRKQHRERFQELYGVKLGFMSFFVKGVIDALKRYPELNGEIRGSNIIYRNYYHIGIAIGGERGLVVPVLRDAQRMSFADIERCIGDFASRAQENKLQPDELEGGTFTITNGGIYGSLLSTPIVNPPQSGVLGMHAIQERPVAMAGQVVIRPMMYVALTYDHRIVDGREAVSFLKRVKEAIEDPSRMLIEA